MKEKRKLALGRLLYLINQSEDAESLQSHFSPITQVQLSNKPSKTLPIELAKRLIKKKAKLPGKQFTSLEQLADTPKVDRESLVDLLDRCSQFSDDFFLAQMTGSVLPSNFMLSAYATSLTPLEFERLSTSLGALKDWVAQRVAQISLEVHNNPIIADLSLRYIQDSYFEFQHSPHLASFGFGLWFYRFDEDNWFTFDQVQQASETYLSYFGPGGSNRFDFYLAKGFPNKGITKGPITVPDLPVVLSHAEKRIVLWAGQLLD